MAAVETLGGSSKRNSFHLYKVEKVPATVMTSCRFIRDAEFNGTLLLCLYILHFNGEPYHDRLPMVTIPTMDATVPVLSSPKTPPFLLPLKNKPERKNGVHSGQLLNISRYTIFPSNTETQRTQSSANYR